MMPYERFEAWQVAHQLRRAALSAPTNIAEGAAKRGNREFRRFLDIALGSLSGVSYLLRFSRDRGLLTPESWLAIEAIRSRAGRLTWRLYSAVSRASDRSAVIPP